MTDRTSHLRAQIKDPVGQFHAAQSAAKPFAPGESAIPVSGKVFDAAEIQRLVDASLDFWLTTGRYAERFERECARWTGVRECALTNSGSSANLFSDFGPDVLQTGGSPARSRRRNHYRRRRVSNHGQSDPSKQNNLVPVLVDASVPTYNVDPAALEAALSPRTPRAVVFAHTLGNPFDVMAVSAFARKHGLWLIERCRRLALLQPEGGRLRRPRNRQFLTRPAHYCGRRRRCPHR